MRIVVTGGRGDLGSRVVRELTSRGHDVESASRRTGVDLATGAGLEAALRGAEAVVHCATSPRRAWAVDVEGARRLAEALSRLERRPHLVSISIVGCDASPFAYYRAKTQSERLIQRSGVPATVVRATQFHALAAFLARALTLGPIGLTIGDLAVQPVDVQWVATRLADYAVGRAPDTFRPATDLAGPEVFSLPEVAALLADHQGRRAPRTLRLPPMGGTMRAFSERRNLPSQGVETGGRTFATWLAAQPARLPRGIHDHS